MIFTPKAHSITERQVPRYGNVKRAKNPSALFAKGVCFDKVLTLFWVYV